MLDWLKGILGTGYTEEIDKQVSSEIGKHFISRSDFNVLNESKKALESQLSEANSKIESFKNLDIEGIKKAADDWKQKYDTATQQAQKDIEAMKLDFALNNALTGAKARNATAVRALLKLDDIKLTESGEVVGLDEQLKKVKEENAFLFDDAKPARAMAATPGVDRVPGGNDHAEANNALRAFMGKE